MRARIFTMLTAALILTGFVFAASAASAAEEKKEITVFAAASLTDVITELSKKYEKETGNKVKLNFASSSTLARQIDSGAPADVYFSANQKWMDFLQKKVRIVKSTRKDVLSNSIVIIAPKDKKAPKIKFSKDFDFAKAINGKLSLGDPDHVPAGMYAKGALTYYGWFKAVEGKILPSPDVRAALLMVERGEAPLGIVYATDAKASKKVKVIATFPKESHKPITYCAAVCKEGEKNAEAVAFFKYATSKKVTGTFARYGFKKP